MHKKSYFTFLLIALKNVYKFDKYKQYPISLLFIYHMFKYNIGKHRTYVMCT